MAQLPTDRNFTYIAFFPGKAANELNTIINHADGQVTQKKDVSSFLHMYKACSRMNTELSRRGIDYQIAPCFCKKNSGFLALFIIPSYPWLVQMTTALNLLSDDYNKRGG